MPPEPGGVGGAADLDQHALETSGLGKFTKPRRDPGDLRRFVARGNFEHRVGRAAHRAAEAAQRLRVEIERARIFHQHGEAAAPVFADEVMQQRGLPRAEKTSHEGDGQAAVHSAT